MCSYSGHFELQSHLLLSPYKIFSTARLKYWITDERTSRMSMRMTQLSTNHNKACKSLSQWELRLQIWSRSDVFARRLTNQSDAYKSLSQWESLLEIQTHADMFARRQVAYSPSCVFLGVNVIRLGQNSLYDWQERLTDDWHLENRGGDYNRINWPMRSKFANYEPIGVALIKQCGPIALY